MSAGKLTALQQQRRDGRVTGTWLQHETTQAVPSNQPFDCAGLYRVTCQTVNPDGGTSNVRRIYREDLTSIGLFLGRSVT